MISRGTVAAVERRLSNLDRSRSPAARRVEAWRAFQTGAASLDQYALIWNSALQDWRHLLERCIPVLVAGRHLGVEFGDSFDPVAYPPDEPLPQALIANIAEMEELAQGPAPWEWSDAPGRDSRRFKAWASARAHFAYEYLLVGGHEALGWRHAVWEKDKHNRWRLCPAVVAACREPDDHELDLRLHTTVEQAIQDVIPSEFRSATRSDYWALVEEALRYASVNGQPPAWSYEVTAGQTGSAGEV